MIATQIGNGVKIKGVGDFDCQQTFTCGQCFRWQMEADGSYTGVAYGKVINIRTEADSVWIDNATLEEYDTIWRTYLDLDRDYSAIKKKISRDTFMKKVTAYGWGIHILRQDLWETILSFIVSQQSNIPKIKRVIEALCRKYGRTILYKENTYYSFPSPEQLCHATTEDFIALGCGYRAKYIKRVVEDVLSGTLDLQAISQLPRKAARDTLLQIYGIGPKVADCIMLFALGDASAFPVDVWMQRVMEEQYSKYGKPALAGHQLFGAYSGYAQQYLFYWRKEQ